MTSKRAMPRGRPFEKGRSGNPKGRPRRSHSLPAVIERELDRIVEIPEQGRIRRYRKRELLLRQLINQALKLKRAALEDLSFILDGRAEPPEDDDSEDMPMQFVETRPGVIEGHVIMSDASAADRRRSFRALAERILSETVTLTENGRSRRYTRRELLARELVNGAIRMKPAAIRRLLRLLATAPEMEPEDDVLFVTLNIGDKPVRTGQNDDD